MNNNKFLYNKKMIGKRVAVIKTYKPFSFYFGIVDSAKDDSALIIKNENDERIEVSIFDIRNPNQEIF